MCLIAFALGTRPGMPLLLAANRDEFFDRPTAPWHRWTLPCGTEVLGGRDLRDGGTWLGVSLTGRVAMLTNVRMPQAASGLRSRGELVTRWLAGERLDTWRTSLVPQSYGGFNLVMGDLRTGVWHWTSNCDPRNPSAGVVDKPISRSLAPGVYGLSNATIDIPWPKTLRVKQAMTQAIGPASDRSRSTDWKNDLVHALADQTQACVDELPATGVGLEREMGLSSPFVQLSGQGYGTRSSLVLRIRETEQPARWQLDAHEWTHTPLAPGQSHQWDNTRQRTEFLVLGT